MTLFFNPYLRRPIRGTSLVEALACLAIIGTATSVATFSISRVSGFFLDQTVQSLMVELKLAATFARTSSTIVYLEFDAGKRQFSFEGTEAQINFPEASDIVMTGASSQATGQGSENVRLAFYPDGQTSGADISLTVRDVSHRITVNWLTGYIQHAKE